MNACRRFEQEGLLRLEQGLPLDAHFSTCADCQAARQSYERLKSDLSSLDAIEPPAHWQARVWQGIATQEKRIERRPLRSYLLPAAGLAAAAMVAIMLWPSAIQPTGSPSLAINFQSGAAPVRTTIEPGSTLPPGTSLLLNAESGGARYSEVRLYRNDAELVAQGSGMTRVVLDGVGRYQLVLLTSNQPIPQPSASLEADIVAARQAGATVTLADPIIIR